jgi:hypothetical protein
MTWILYVGLIRCVSPSAAMWNGWGHYTPFPPSWQNECSNFGVFLSSLKVVEDGYEFFAKRQLVTLFSAPNYCGEFDNAGAMMSVDETLLCSFQVRRLTPSFFFRVASRLSVAPIVDTETRGEETEISKW